MFTKTFTHSIAISGSSGTGKGATTAILAERLGLPIISAGNIMRGEAERLGITLRELKEKTRGDQFLDYWLDTTTRLAVIEHQGGAIVEGRLVAFTVPEGVFKVLLTVEDEDGNEDHDERFRRIALRDKLTHEEAREATKHREEHMDQRYQEFYGLRYAELFEKDIYHFSVSTRSNPPEKVAEIILGAYSKHLKGEWTVEAKHRTLPIFHIE